MLFLSEGQGSETWEPSNKAKIFSGRKSFLYSVIILSSFIMPENYNISEKFILHTAQTNY
jgi:hypothetical protein